ncbi:MAG TPA: 4Fe-4S binding protein [Kofleriaceae bacterium]|jgi:ferredoxin
MTYVITSPCVGTCDTACVDVCPVDCIVGPVPVEELRAVPVAERAKQFGDIQMFIDPDECICCGACTGECPVDAIHHRDLVPLRHRDDIARNANFFLKK